MALAATTLGLCILGIAGSIWLAVRRGVAAAGLGVVFAASALRQAVLLRSGDLPAWAPDGGIGALLSEGAMLAVALGALVGLRALRRTTRERDRVEDLHWDSMEAVRVISELAAHPGSGFEGRLGSMLELGIARFGLDLGVAWLLEEGRDDASAEPTGRVLGVRAPQIDAERRDACVAALLPRLREAIRAPRPLLLEGPGGESPTCFAVAVRSDGVVHGALAFASIVPHRCRFTATEKDLLGLMAQWLAAELDRRAPAERDLAPVPTLAPEHEVSPVPTLALARVARGAFRPRRGVDLNRDVSRLESRLRQRVGTDATLALDLGPDLPPLARGRLSLPRLLEGLVDAAARLAPTGRIELSTHAPGEDAREVTLRVCVTARGVDAEALGRAFDASLDTLEAEEVSRAVLSLPAIERLLRADGGDLSVSIEPGRRAVLTVWLPVAASQTPRAEPLRAELDQSSR